MGFELRVMQIEDYDLVITLWRATEGIGLSQADSRENIARYLDRNPGSSFCAWDGDRLVGAVLCGNDARRGYLNHLAVDRDYRCQGIGKALVDRCLDALNKIGITKCHLFVFQKNLEGISFWERIGWSVRHDLHIMSIDLD